MYSPGPERGPLNAQERVIYIAFVALFLGLFTAEVFSNYEPVKLGVLLFLAFWIPLLVLHEVGHAIMAALVGWRVEKIVIGMGRTLKRSAIGDVEIEVRLLPLEGFVRCAPKNLTCPGLKHSLIYFAGPGIELLLAAFILWQVGPSQFFVRSHDYGIIVWQSLAIAATTGAILNLIPHTVQVADGFIPMTGLVSY